MDENKISDLVYNEKIDNLRTANEKLEYRVAELEKKTDRIDNNFVKLETKFDIYTVTTSEKFDSLAKESRESSRKLEDKLDKVMESVNRQVKEHKDDFSEWVKKLGLKIIEYAILAGLIYGIMNAVNII